MPSPAPISPTPSPGQPESRPRDSVRRYRVRHVTRYAYQGSVEFAQHVLHLEPRDLPARQSVQWSLAVTPEPSVKATHHDSFGNPETYLAMQEPHTSVEIVSSLEVNVLATPVLDYATTPAWESVASAIAGASDEAARQAAAFAYISPRVPLLAELRDYASVSFTAGRPVADAAFDLMTRIHGDYSFDPVATTVATPLADVLRLKRGVCQDLAHVFIGCLRAVGLPAAYVSGYLRTIPPPGQKRLEGSDASHAWARLWCGGALWLDLDPTNAQALSLDYVTVAWGRDYGDVSPVRGIVFGGGNQTLTVMVDVVPEGEAA